MRKGLIILIISSLCHVALSQWDSYNIVAPFVKFIVFRQNQPKYFFDDLVADAGTAATICPSDVNVSWVVHGWGQGNWEGYFINTPWIPLVTNNILNVTGGCVIVMDYSYYCRSGYDQLINRYTWFRDILVNAMKIFKNYQRMYAFGHDFGSRLLQGAGNVLTNENNNVPAIAKMDLCDPINWNFDGDARYVPSYKAASNVACINTFSDGVGTRIFDCHQNFRMGHCGKWQDGSGQGNPSKDHHGMCPYFYNFAFTFTYKYDPLYDNECPTGMRNLNATCKQNMVVGMRNNVYCIGDLPVPTSRCAPFVYYPW